MSKKQDILHIAKALEIATRIVMSEIRPEIWKNDLRPLFTILLDKIDDLGEDNE